MVAKDIKSLWKSQLMQSKRLVGKQNLFPMKEN
jgi:hypothetical protein